MTGRKCGTCKHFEAAPIWRKGWCRNPLLYSPQQSHLVGEEDLDCERGMGNYWEASSLVVNSPDPVRPASAEPAPPSRSLPVVTHAGQQVFVVSGSSGYGNDSGPEPPPGAGGRGGPPPGGAGGGPLNYYAEERYWTDYLRIAAPILGVLLLVVLFWLWASSFLGDDDGNGGTGVATGTTTLPTIGPTSTAGGTPDPSGSPTSPIVITTVTPPAGATTTTAAPGDPTPTSEPAPPTDIFPGAVVVVANTGGDGANLRLEPSSGSEVVTTLLEGTELTVTGDAVEADGLIWWPVTGVDGDGYVASDFLTLLE